MPHLTPYHIFISHAWKYGEDYERLTSLLDRASYFDYYNYSAPKDKPLHNLDYTSVTTKSQIKAAIDRKIRPCGCVLVISGMYTNYREWMQYEIDTALRMNKPIIAIKPWGAQAMPLGIQMVAKEIVGWSTESIVSAIRKWG